jgi:hypothetical protein
MKKTHDYAHYYRGYWSNGGKGSIRIYHGEVRRKGLLYTYPGYYYWQ